MKYLFIWGRAPGTAGLLSFPTSQLRHFTDQVAFLAIWGGFQQGLGLAAVAQPSIGDAQGHECIPRAHICCLLMGF